MRTIMRDRPEDLWIDANGVPTERVRLGDQVAVVRYDTIPEKDLAVVDGIPCTTALRTVIDLAADLGTDELWIVVQDCLRRGLFTVDQVLARTDEADMRSRAGARMLRRLLCPPV